MYVANATGCSSIWGGSAPLPYTVNSQGRGPAWGKTLFEDNAEFGYGMKLAVRQRRAKLHSVITELAKNMAFAEIANRWLAERDDYAASVNWAISWWQSAKRIPIRPMPSSANIFWITKISGL